LLGSVSHLRLECFQHAWISRLFVGQPKRIVTLGTEIHRIVRAPHVSLIVVRWFAALGNDVIITSATLLFFSPPNGLIVKIVAPQKARLEQTPVIATPGFLKYGGTMVQAIHPEYSSFLSTICVGENVPPIIPKCHAMHNGIMVVFQNSF